MGLKTRGKARADDVVTEPCRRTLLTKHAKGVVWQETRVAR
jgi:hypothetical protein